MEDHTHMTFGKYGPKSGDHRIMKDIPAGYLLWLWDNVLWNSNVPHHLEVKSYIQKVWRALLIDAPDYIPTHPPK